ncbi:MAG: hypothetical protein D6798_13890 [Deltaproteobacteria bacterium]|nr:MAG: hypothetical protein D6798_13890 [Deltaproteobacteria bacterium]
MSGLFVHVAPGMSAMVTPLIALLLAGGLGCTDKGDAAPDTAGGDTGGTASTLAVALTRPSNGSWYIEGSPPEVEVIVVDHAGLGVSGLSLTWSGTAIADIDPPLETDDDGTASFSLSPDLAVGMHSLGVLAVRDDGAAGVASVAFEIVDPDKDLDGYLDATYGGDDCDDEDPTINPAGEEFCDNADNDCDGLVDEEDAVDILTWYEDLDADGFGKTEVTEVDCDQPKDFVLLDNDCDDDDPAINPLAAEVCDLVDNDCDGLVDDEDPGLGTASATAFYPDDDGDGFGDYSRYLLACAPPDGWTMRGGDCDDGDATVNPDAVEYCDGLDNNCVDGVDEDTAVDATAWYVDEDHDGWGVEGATVLACNQPTGGAAEVGDCDDTDETVNPGALEVCNDGADTDCDGEWQPCEGALVATDARLLGEATLDEAGYAIAPLGDVDGDGVDDLAVGARGRDGEAGAAYIVLGPISGATSLADAHARWEGEESGSRAGRALSAGPDVDGDGSRDLLVAAPSLDDDRTLVGGVYVVTGSQLTDPGTRDLADAWHRFSGEQNYGYLGVGVALADLDQDGSGDVLMGASSYDGSASNAGAVYLYLGPISAGTTDLRDGTWDARIAGEAGGDQAGENLAGMGDLDGDGTHELLVGVPNGSVVEAAAGTVYLFSSVPGGDLTLADADVRIDGGLEGDGLGAFVQAADIDGDGRDDLLTGAPDADDGGSESGAAYLVAGRADLSALDGSRIPDVATATISGASTGQSLGVEGAADGDHDGDGQRDVLVGAPGADDGAVLLFLGPLSGSVTSDDADAAWLADTTTEGVGQAVIFGGSLVDGATDAIVAGARSADIVASDAGAVLIAGSTGL